MIMEYITAFCSALRNLHHRLTVTRRKKRVLYRAAIALTRIPGDGLVRYSCCAGALTASLSSFSISADLLRL